MDLQELSAIAAAEMAKHGLREWSFAFANTKRRLGACKYRQKRIEIAGYYAEHSPRESVIDTLLHEIAHALAGQKAGHGQEWKVIAVRIGATPKACEKSSDIVVKPGDWQATCPACQTTHHRYRRPRVLNGYQCRCAARSRLTFAYAGEPLSLPQPSTRRQAIANWEAKCAGCQIVHLRVKRPKEGLWRCRCPNRCELTWQRRS